MGCPGDSPIVKNDVGGLWKVLYETRWFRGTPFQETTVWSNFDVSECAVQQRFGICMYMSFVAKGEYIHLTNKRNAVFFILRLDIIRNDDSRHWVHKHMFEDTNNGAGKTWIQITFFFEGLGVCELSHGITWNMWFTLKLVFNFKKNGSVQILFSHVPITYQKMVIWGMWYYCFTFIIAFVAHQIEAHGLPWPFITHIKLPSRGLRR